MRLGEIINEYRSKNRMSMDEFAKRSGLSKAYIGFLEKGFHPKTLNPINPSVDAINKCARAMNMDFSTLFNMMDEVFTLTPSNVESDNELDCEEDEYLKLFRSASPEKRKAALAVLKDLQQPSDPLE